MATTNISSDVSTLINITARKFDSFYLKVTITNEDDTPFSFTNYTLAQLDIKNANGSLVKSFRNTGNPTTSTTETDKPATINPGTGLQNDDGILIIDVPYSTSLPDETPVVDFVNMNILVGSYDYTLTLSGSSERATVMHGKFKIID